MSKIQILNQIWRHNDRIGVFPFDKFDRLDDQGSYEVYNSKYGKIYYDTQNNMMHIEVEKK